MKISILALSALLAAPDLVHAQADTAASRRTAVENGLTPAVVIEGGAGPRRLADEMRALNVPGVAIAVVRGGKVDWAQGYGVTRIGGAPVDADTLFQAGSVSKPVAAAVAMTLVQAGTLSLDAPINTELKSWSLPDNDFTRAAPVTLRRLLSHSAGTSVHGFAGYAAGAAIPTVPQVLDGAAPANSKPVRVDQPVGASFRYSGGGYTIAQLAVVDTAKAPFPTVARRALLAPLGMTRSTYDQPLPAQTPNIALPYDAAGHPIPGGPHTYPEMAAAGLWTSASDLARFVIEMQRAPHGQGKVLSQKTAREMLTPGLGEWGLGLQVTGEGKDLAFAHDGSNAGYKAAIIGHPESGDGVVVLTNGDQGYQLAQEIVRGVAIAYGWSDQRPVVRRAMTLPLEAQRRFAGVFEIKDLGTFEIREADGALVVELRKGQAFKLIPSSDHAFFITEQNIALTFDDPDQGGVQADGQPLKFQRVATVAR